MGRIANLLNQSRDLQFVGREDEIRMFTTLLQKNVLDTFLLFFYGPGGQGKTTLMKQFQGICKDLNVSFTQLDARYITPSPADFLEAFSGGVGTPTGENTFEFLEKLNSKYVLFIDTYEKLNPIDDWIRQDFLPQMPENVLTIICGKNEPSASWVIDTGWQSLMKSRQIRNLSPEESSHYLTKRKIPEDRFLDILSFTHGHPLALSVVADMYDQYPSKAFRPEESPDIIRTLLEQFLTKVPGPANRAVLEICALAHVTTESLLREVMQMEEMGELFDWLRTLSFIDQGKFGIFPHDLARESLVTDLRWRNPDWYQELHEKIRNYYLKRLGLFGGEAQRKILFDLIYLHRNNPVVRPFFDWQETGSVWVDLMNERDEEVLRQMVERFEGKKSELLFNFWHRHPSVQVWVFRDADKAAAGCLLKININELSEEDASKDLAIHKLYRYAQKELHLRKNEMVTVFRFWMGRYSYQQVSSIQSSIFLTAVQYYLTTPGLAVTFFGCSFPAAWNQLFQYADMQHIPEGDFQNEGGQPYGFFMHDWRQRPAIAWLDVLSKRETQTPSDTINEQHKVQLIVLSEAEFESCVYEALKNLYSGKQLSANPLSQSKIVLSESGEQSDGTSRTETLQKKLQEAIAILEKSPKDEKLYRVIYRTFVNPVGSQEQTADFLNLPFSTYRRYLKSGVQKVTEMLWEQEIL